MKALIIILSVIVAVACLALAILAHPAFGTYRHVSKEKIQASPHFRDGMFRNEEFTPQFTGKSNMFQSMWRMLTSNTSMRTPDKPLPAVKTDLKKLTADCDWLVWFGHSSYMFCLGDKRFLIDPVLTTAFPASLMMKPFEGTDIYTPADLPDIDVLIITHEHWDHMDYATLKQLKTRVTQVFCPLGIADYLRYWGYKDDQITEMDWGEYRKTATTDDENGLTLTCLPSRHFSNRLFKRNQTLWASFMVEYQGRKVYVGGDGGYDSRFKRIQKQFGNVDLAFLENGQYNDNWRYIHTTPADLEQVMLDLQAQQVFTVHHDKFALAMHPWNEPDSVAKSIADKHGIRLLDAPIGSIVKF